MPDKCAIAPYEGLDPFQGVAGVIGLSIMPRLSDRAFKIIELEIQDLHNQGAIDKLDKAILVSRLQTLQAGTGKPLSRAQIWEALSDIIPGIDLKVLTSAAYPEKGSPKVTLSLGLGAAAVLVASTAGMEATTASVGASDSSPETLSASQDEVSRQTQETRYVAQPVAKVETSQPRFSWGRKRAVAKSPETDAFAEAKRLGWQAALNGQNPPYSAQHWQETATMWRQALVYLNQVPRSHSSYAMVPEKIEFYQKNLKEVERRIAGAIAREKSEKQQAAQTVKPEEDYLAIARRYGYQAALAGKKAPHPASEWAEISRTWRTALLTLDKISPEHSQYAEAQQVIAEYQQNLEAVRQRYRQEQSASQSVASLRAALVEIQRSGRHRQTKQAQIQAIRAKLQAIPSGTDASLQAQKVLGEMGQSGGGVGSAIATLN